MERKKPDTLMQNDKLNTERVHMLYEHIHQGSVSYYIWLTALFTILIISNADIPRMIIWAVLAVSIHLIKEHVISIFLTLKTIDNPSRWEQYMIFSSFMEGIIISAGMMILIDLNQYLTAYVSIALLVIPAYVSALVLITSSRTHYAWVLAMLIPVVVKSLSSNDSLHWIFGGVTLVVGIPISALLGKKLNETFIDTLKLRFENAELLATAQEEKKRAEKANADKTRFLASASHDLRQPIHALELFTDALEHELNSPVQFDLMKKMKESTAAMNDLLCSLLDISKLDAGIVKVNKRAIDLTTLLEKLIKTLQPQAKLKGVNIQFNSETCAAYSDSILLESMFHNLLNNALKYTDKGTIRILYKVAKNKIRVSIEDTGIGISESNMNNIFEAFFQVNNKARDRSKGLGLGLTIVKNTCKLLGHTVEVQSIPGKGSVFTVVLDTADVNDIEQLPYETPSFNKLHATVLVIDDERSILEGMEKMLSPWGCNVLAAASLKEALILVKECNEGINVIIADYRLQDGKLGTDAISTIQKTQPEKHIPAIVITGDTGPEQLKDVKRSGYHVLHKPVIPMRIRALIQNLLK